MIRNTQILFNTEITIIPNFKQFCKKLIPNYHLLWLLNNIREPPVGDVIINTLYGGFDLSLNCLSPVRSG